MVVSRITWVWAEVNAHFNGASETSVGFFTGRRDFSWPREHVRTLTFKTGGDCTVENAGKRWGKLVTHAEVPEWFAQEQNLPYEA